MNEVDKAKVLAASVSYTKKEVSKLREEIQKIKDRPQESSMIPALYETMQGEKGQQGPKGDRGEQGEKGEPGQAIVVEALGPQGDKGEQGEAGKSISEAKIVEDQLVLLYDDGNSERVGQVVGPRGGQGIMGEEGPTGPQGEKGTMGEIGPTGPTGPRGLLGEQGEIGPQGPIGPMGIKGDKGDQGEQGIPGPTGAQGEQGTIGPQGAAGEKGERGEPGPMGSEGPRGADGTQVDTDGIKKSLEKDLTDFKTSVQQQVTRLATTGGGSSSGGGIGLFPKDTFRPRDIVPEANSIYSLGSDGLRFKDLFLSGNTIALGGATMGASADGAIELPKIKVGTAESGFAEIAPAAGGGIALPEGSKIGSESIQIAVSDEGTEVGNNVSFINFVGSGVAATGNTSHITVTVSGGGGGGSGTDALARSGIVSTNTALRTLISDRIQVANVSIYAAVANVQSIAALANTNAAIATKLASSSYTAGDVQTKAALANTNSAIATKLASSSYTTGDVQTKAALANTNSAIALRATKASPVFTGPISANGSTGTANFVLKSAGSGNAFWGVDSGGGGASSFTLAADSGSNDTFEMGTLTFEGSGGLATTVSNDKITIGISTSTSTGRLTYDEFSGTGSQNNFTITTQPPAADDLLVTLDGVTQRPATDYFISGTTLTFTTAPASGVTVGSRLVSGQLTQGTGAGFFQGDNGTTGDTSTGKKDIFRTHESTLNSNTTIGTHNAADNSLCAGPLTVATGTTLTISNSCTLVIA